MDSALPESLLEKFASDDRAVTEEVMRLFEPFLLRVVRRHLTPAQRAKFDAADVVQSVWLHLLQSSRADRSDLDADRLRGFLARVAHNRRIDHVRRLRAALRYERPLPEGEGGDALWGRDAEPHEQLQADELWARMLDLCPPEHRAVLLLKRDGARTTEIAARTGLHEGSVRRILRELSRKLGGVRESDEPSPE